MFSPSIGNGTFQLRTQTEPDANVPNEVTVVKGADQADLMNIVINQSASGSNAGSVVSKKVGKKGKKVGGKKTST